MNNEVMIYAGIPTASAVVFYSIRFFHSKFKEDLNDLKKDTGSKFDRIIEKISGIEKNLAVNQAVTEGLVKDLDRIRAQRPKTE
jgi:hypothetical protein